MYKMLTIVFNDEKTAYEGARALSELNVEGSISVYALAVIQKKGDGTLATRKVDGDFPLQTFAGTAIGALIGLLGGPAGVAVGSSVGVVAGLVGDLYTADVDSEFLSDVSSALLPGRSAVVAEVDEDWVTPVDTRMETLGGLVFRTLKSSVERDHWSRTAADAREELQQLKAEHAQARADRKAKLQRQIEQLSKRVDIKLERAKTRSQQVAREFQARAAAMQRRVDQETGAKKAALEARVAKLRDDYENRRQS